MSDSDRRSNCFGSVAKMLSTVMLFTVAITFVWIWSDQMIAKNSVRHTTSVGPAERDHGLVSVSTRRVTPEHERIFTSAAVAIQEPTEERAPRHSTRAEQSRFTTWSWNADVLQDNRLIIGQSMSENRTPLIVVREKSIKKIPHSTNHRGDNTSIAVDENLNTSDTSQILYNMNISDKDSEENKNSIDRINWTTFFSRLDQIIPEKLLLLKTSRSDSFDQPHFGLRTHYQNTKDSDYRFKHNINRDHKIPKGQYFPLTNSFDFKTQPIQETQQDSLILQPSSISTVENNTLSSLQKKIIEIPLINEKIWRIIALIALIKLGLVKLKTVVFIKILFLILLKLKFILVTLFFKFFSLLKLVKFSILQLFFLPLATIIFLIIMKTSSIYTPLMNTLYNNNNPGTFSDLNTPIPNIKEVLISPETMFFVENVHIPSSESILIPSNDLLPPAAPTIPGRSPIQNTPNSNIQSDNDNINFLGGLQYEPLEVLDPTLDLFQKELNSETCVERIACKIAATGKTGIIPLWINWILHQVSKPIPNDKLLYYLKAYNDVIDEIQTKSPNPDDWETWCFERYDCSNTDHR